MPEEFDETLSNDCQETALPSWTAVLQDVNKREDGKVRKWRNELDTLVIVGGLWSIVVSLFALESYRWLSEEPATTTITILTQISQQLDNRNTSIHSPGPPFNASGFVVSINCLWFLSLIITMGSTIIGLLCKQWLHEHYRQTRSRTPLEALALQHLRAESLGRWGVSSIITLLPVLLQLALLIFLAGLLQVFWLKSVALFVVGFAAIGLIFLFYSGTTLLPIVQIIHHALTTRSYHDTPSATLFHLTSLQSVCPYKTPQSWAIFVGMRAILRTSFIKYLLYRSSGRRHSFGILRDALDRNLRSVIDWSSFDLQVVRMFEGLNRAPPFYGIQGLQWLLRTCRDTETISNLGIIIESLPSTLSSLVTCTAFDEWKLPLWKTFGPNGIRRALKNPVAFFAEERSEAWLDPYGTDRYVPSPHSPEYTQLLYHLFSWENDNMNWSAQYEMTERLYKMDIPRRVKMPFVVPFYQLNKLWSSSAWDQKNDTVLFEKGGPLDFLHFYESGWEIATRLNSGHHDKLALVNAFADHILAYDRSKPSMLFKSSRAWDFAVFLNDRLATEKLGKNGRWIFADMMEKWDRAVIRIHMIMSQSKDSEAELQRKEGEPQEEGLSQRSGHGEPSRGIAELGPSIPG